MTEKEFSIETIKYVDKADLSHRKKFGQYFTPKFIRDELIKQLPRSIKNPRVLDPACGTGEFLITAREYFKSPELYGWEIDEKLVKIANKLVPQANLVRADSLEKEECGRFDFVIGNPPISNSNPVEN